MLTAVTTAFALNSTNRAEVFRVRLARGGSYISVPVIVALNKTAPFKLASGDQDKCCLDCFA